MFQLRRARRSALAGIVLVAVAGSATAFFSGGGTAAAEPTPIKPQAKRYGPTWSDSEKVAKDSYIVVLKDKTAKAADVTADAKSLTQTYGGTVRHTYSKTLRGYAAKMTAAQAKQLAKDPAVARVEPDRWVTKLDGSGAAWGIDRVDQQWPPRDGSYTATNSASNVHAYVIDTGIRTSHEQFDGRASYGVDAVTLGPEGQVGGNRDGDSIPTDCDGHGTHVAGTIGSRNYGVATGVQLVAVQVLDCGGGGFTSEVVAGIEWVTANAIKPAVANMSLGGEIDPLIDAAVQASIASGITYTVSAGNGTVNPATGLPVPQDACDVSPARVPGAITVSATDEADFRVSWAGFGACVDIFAPGSDLLSTYYDAVSGQETLAYLSGTSMASPHVAGAAALLLSDNPGMTPTAVRDSLVGNATRGAVKNPRAGSPDRLLRIGSGLPSTTALRAKANGKLVTTPSTGASALIASAAQALPWEQFNLIQNGDGTISFQAHSNGRYVSADSRGTKPLIANRTAIGDWEKFELVDNGDGTISLLARANGKYVSADFRGTKPLIANRTAIGDWEKFTWTSPVPAIYLVAYINDRVVTAESRGTKPLIANRDAYGPWEEFDMIDLGNGNIALRAHANGKYVSAESAGAKPLIASRTAIGKWETFELLQLGGPALKAAANGRWVCAESRGTKPLIANRAAPGAWEVFYYLF